LNNNSPDIVSSKYSSQPSFNEFSCPKRKFIIEKRSLKEVISKNKFF
jgi:hypothetical protein